MFRSLLGPEATEFLARSMLRSLLAILYAGPLHHQHIQLILGQIVLLIIALGQFILGNSRLVSQSITPSRRWVPTLTIVILIAQEWRVQ